MTTRTEPVYLGNSIAALFRVVWDRSADLELGIETGIVTHRRSEIPVWRPANPQGLGLDHSWRDGRWRNVYETRIEIAPHDADGFCWRAPTNVAGITA